MQSIANVESLADLELIEPEHIILLGQHSPAVLHRWVLDNLGLEETDNDDDWIHAIRRGAAASENGVPDQELTLALQLKRYPVDIETFLFDPYYLGKARREVYPEVLAELVAINNAGGRRIVNPYTEGVFTGGIGSAKSTTALYTNAYQLYVLSCFYDPHLAFNLDSSSEIVFVFLAVAGDAASVDYERFYAMLKDSPYFNVDFPYNKRLTTEMHFPNRIQIIPGVNPIGQNVLGGMIDEVNFGAVIQNSKRSRDGGTYNQALTMYTTLARRRKTRFSMGGSMSGILCLVSSRNYEGEFTDLKLEEAKTDASIYIYDKRAWEVKPEGSFSGKWFRVFVGGNGKVPYVLPEGARVDAEDEPFVMPIPVEFRRDFDQDLYGSLRDIAGVGTSAKFPFFTDAGSVAAMFNRHASILNLEETDLVTTQLKILSNRFRDLDKPRWVHVDLGVTGDAAGVACGYVDKFGLAESEIGLMPYINLDFILRVVPPRNGEILFFKIRRLIHLLRDMGLPIQWVSFDGFQSVDSIQLLRQAGFSTGRQQVDRNFSFYAVTKTACYSGRIAGPAHHHCRTEFLRLEKDPRTGIVDHPATGSKDCSDAVAGVVYGLTMRREIWAQNGVKFNAMFNAVKEVNVKNGEA